MRQRMDSPSCCCSTCRCSSDDRVDHHLLPLTTHALYGNWRTRVKRLPLMMSIGIGLSINNARAVLEGLFNRRPSSLARPSTASKGRPTGGSPRSIARASLGTMMEIGWDLFTATMLFAIVNGVWQLPFLVLFQVGFLYTGLPRSSSSTPARWCSSRWRRKNCKASTPNFHFSTPKAPHSLGSWILGIGS